MDKKRQKVWVAGPTEGYETYLDQIIPKRKISKQEKIRTILLISLILILGIIWMITLFLLKN